MDRAEGELVLILEDDPGIAALESRRLARAGYRVQVASTSQQARQALEQGGVSLILLDHRLSGQENGLDFHVRLREAGLAVPSILVTGFGDEATLAQALRTGIRDFIPKTPNYLDYLVPTVQRVLQQVRVERALERERSARAEAEAAKAVLTDADRRKDEFLAMLAHELRNPLAAISGALEVSQRSDAPEDQLWAREVTARQVRHLSRLIDDLMEISRVNLGKIELRKQPTNLVDVINHAAEMVRPQMQSKRHAFTIEVRDRPLPVDGDPTRLEQVLVNLLTNAAKYTDSGGTIRLEASREGSEIVLEVSDTGVGIPPALRSRIFEMFAQVSTESGRSQGGLGIGLNLAKKLVLLHGGTIAVDARPGGPGSVFTIRLPSRPSSEGSHESMAPAAGPTRAPRRILVVDDNVDAARALRRLLTAEGHDVRAAEDGPTALELAAAFRPDVVLLDIGLPGAMDGHELARRLRGLPGLEGACLAAISGYGQDADRTRSFAAGCQFHLVKPVSVHEVMAVLEANPAPRGD
jgi:signal transduction histidine kinase